MRDVTPLPVAPQRAFTIKALAFGILGAGLIAIAGALNNVLRDWQTPVIGNYMPPAPYALVLFLALVWNPTLGRLARLRFATAELAVVLGLCLCCAWVPYSGFARYFTRALVQPVAKIDQYPEWRRYDTFGHLPPTAIPLGGSAIAEPMRAAIAEEQQAVAAGKLRTELGDITPAAYATALDLAALAPARDVYADPALARLGTQLALYRAQTLAGSHDPVRWQATADLLATMPATLAPASGGSPAWALAYTRLQRLMLTRLPESEHAFERVFPAFLNGLPVGNETIGLRDLPTREWLPTLLFWLPLLLCGVVASLMMALMVHRQWSHHEQLRYPLATLATALITRRADRLTSEVFYERLFWWGFVPVVAVHSLNFLSALFPGHLPSITLHWSNSGAIEQVLPILSQSGGGGALAYGDLYFAVIGLTYFIAAEISLSIGLGGVAIILLSTQWYITTGGSVDITALRSGAYFGYAAILIFIGRHYYWALLLAAAGKQRIEIAAEQTWAARLFLLSAAGFMTILVGAFGLDWPVALVFSLTALVMLLVVSRIVCETGLPLVQAFWGPANVVASLLGFAAIGPGPLVSMYLVGAALFADSRESLLPFANTAYKIADDTGVPRFGLAIASTVAIGVALVAGVTATAWGVYQFGGGRDGYAAWPATDGLDAATRGLTYLVDTGRYAAAASAHGLDKISLLGINPGQETTLSWMGFGAFAVVIFSLARFRWAWFPLHPVMFVLMGTWLSVRIWLSVLVGWGIKCLIVRFGGGKVYQDLKPLFIGLVVGELVMAIVYISAIWLCQVITGTMPNVTAIFPG